MAETQDKVERIKQAIHDTLWATGAFGAGIPYSRDEIGKRPFFMVWWGPFRVAESELGNGSPSLSLVTHQLQIDLYVDCRGKGKEQEDQQRLQELTATSVKALNGNHRLGGACVRSRVKAGEPDMYKSGNNMFYAISLTLEADVHGW